MKMLIGIACLVVLKKSFGKNLKCSFEFNKNIVSFRNSQISEFSNSDFKCLEMSSFDLHEFIHITFGSSLNPMI